MAVNSDANTATADALTLLLHNQHSLTAAIEDVTKWISENGGAMETLDNNARAITDAIMRLRQL